MRNGEEHEFLQNSSNFENKLNIRFETTGCRLNQIESESAAKKFVDEGFEVFLEPLTAKSAIDENTALCIINTCAVTQKAEQKDRRIIRLVLEKCPNAVVVVTGCYAQLSPDYIREMGNRVACLPGQIKSRLASVPSLLLKKLSANDFEPVAFAKELNSSLFVRNDGKEGISENAFALSTDSFLAHSRSSIKIQDGCNNRCSYCTINVARGHSVSLDVQTVIDRVVQLEKAGQAEVVFTSVNIGQYRGKYGEEYLDFAHLLNLCLEKTEKISMRISSLYPEVVDDYFCQVIKNPRVRPHFHISVQSGSDAVLKAMARRYFSKDVLEACNKIKAVKDNSFLACDIITGFPGETEKDFEDSMTLCKNCGFAWVHVFPFSARPGTVAFSMKQKVPQSVSGERAARLNEWAAESKRNYIDSCRGKVFDAVLETVKKSYLFAGNSGKAVYHAVTENFLHCEIEADSSTVNVKPGSKVKLRILGQVEQGLKKGGETECRAEFVFDK